MRYVLCVIVTAALGTAATGCDLTSPSESLTGTWTASTGKFSFVTMNLQQSGDDEISGTACARTDGFLLYHGAPVTGEDDEVAFTVATGYTQPCCPHLVGTHFSGRQESSGDIVGRLANVDVRFERSTNDVCR